VEPDEEAEIGPGACQKRRIKNRHPPHLFQFSSAWVVTTPQFLATLAPTPPPCNYVVHPSKRNCPNTRTNKQDARLQDYPDTNQDCRTTMTPITLCSLVAPKAPRELRTTQCSCGEYSSGAGRIGGKGNLRCRGYGCSLLLQLFGVCISTASNITITDVFF
jgi:hypothetical protein